MQRTLQAAFEQHRAQVYAWAYRLVQDHHDALDVTQEVFIRWWRAHHSGPAPSNTIGWLRRVATNLAIDAIRASSKRPAPVSGAEVAIAATDLDPVRRETARQIADALNTLSERQRAVVVAKVFDGCTFSAIAEELEVSVPTAKVHYIRALQALRNKLPGLDDRERGA